MMRPFSVKLLVGMMLAFVSAWAADDEKPDPKELLRSARVAQSNMDWKFTGPLRIGARFQKIPFLLTITNGVIRYDFQDNGDSLTLRLGEKDSRLEETIGGKTMRVTPD